MITRRDFSLGAGLAIPAWAAKIDSRVGGVRIGVQSYSFRGMPLEDALKAMVEIGIGECELFGMHAERAAGGPSMGFGPGGPPRPPQGAGGAPAGGRRGPDPAMRAALREWRLAVPLDSFRAVRKKFDDAGVALHAYNLSFREDFTGEEIDRGFEMAKALGVGVITASSTVSVAKRVAPFADKHKIRVAMHNHANLTDPNEFAKPESFAAALAMSKYFAINLDIGHFTAAGFDAIAYIKQHHKRITNLHLKDRKKNDGPNMPWGQGETPIKEVLHLLRKEKYPIPADIEYEYRGEGEPAVEVRKCFQYCRDALG